MIVPTTKKKIFDAYLRDYRSLSGTSFIKYIQQIPSNALLLNFYNYRLIHKSEEVYIYSKRIYIKEIYPTLQIYKCSMVEL